MTQPNIITSIVLVKIDNIIYIYVCYIANFSAVSSLRNIVL